MVDQKTSEEQKQVNLKKKTSGKQNRLMEKQVKNRKRSFEYSFRKFICSPEKI